MNFQSDQNKFSRNNSGFLKILDGKHYQYSRKFTSSFESVELSMLKHLVRGFFQESYI